MEGGRGIVIGTCSLFKNTTAGALNSVNKITGAVSTGLATLTMVYNLFF